MEDITLIELLNKRRQSFISFISQHMPDGQLKMVLFQLCALPVEVFISRFESYVYPHRSDLMEFSKKLSAENSFDFEAIPIDIRTKFTRFLEFFCDMIDELNADDI